jgi:2-amino-4-hydroxy-6-hydroxymethyldihydropteridine diphosphokinase
VRRILPERAALGLGSNIEPEQNLVRATVALKDLGELRSSSNVYQNPAIGRAGQPDYLNAALLLETELPPLDLRQELRKIERRLGRVRTADRYAARTIDLDLCLYGDLILATPELTLPDPDILHRPHLALTLSELEPGFIYPGSGESLGTIAQRLNREANLKLREDVSSTLKALIDA